MSVTTDKTMTKRMIANEVARRVGITQSAAFEAVKAMLGTISDTLAAGGHIELRGFGIFEVVTRCQRVGRNPNNPSRAAPQRIYPPRRPARLPWVKERENDPLHGMPCKGSLFFYSIWLSTKAVI